jgi:hypothetical protein
MAMASSSSLALPLLRYVSSRVGAVYRLRTKPVTGVAAATSSTYHGEAGHDADIAAATEVPWEVGVAEQLRVTSGRERGSPPGGGSPDKPRERRNPVIIHAVPASLLEQGRHRLQPEGPGPDISAGASSQEHVGDEIAMGSSVPRDVAKDQQMLAANARRRVPQRRTRRHEPQGQPRGPREGGGGEHNFIAGPAPTTHETQ